MKLGVDIVDGLEPRLRMFLGLLGGAGRTEILRASGTEVQRVTVDYIARLAATRHETASRLGAAPTNHFAQAAEKVASPAALEADADAATLTISHPGFSRAFRNVVIAPRSAKALAIPVHAISYGKRAAELWDRLSLFIPKGKRVIAATLGGVVTPLYILCKSVTQKQDRTLLPADEEFRAAAALGAKQWLATTLMKGSHA